MAIGDLSKKVSKGDMDIIRSKNNSSDYLEGFEDDEGSGSVSDFFDNLDDFGGEDKSSNFGGFDSFGDSSDGGSSPFSSFGGGSSPFGSNDSPFGSFGGGDGTFGNTGFGGFGNTASTQPTEDKKDSSEKIMEFMIDAVKEIGPITKSLVSSIKTRNSDDWGIYSKKLIIHSGILLISSVVLSVLGTILRFKPLYINRIPAHMMIASGICGGLGLIVLGCAALAILKNRVYDSGSEEDIQEEYDFDSLKGTTYSDTEDEDSDFNFDDGDLSSILGSLMDNEEDDENDPWNIGSQDEEDDDTLLNNFMTREKEEEEVDLIESIPSNVPLINRKFLYETFKPFFIINVPDFNLRKELDTNDDDFAFLETTCLKAIAEAAKKDLKEIDSYLESATETYFCYIIRLKRVKGLNKLQDIEREIVAYFRSSVDDDSVNAKVDLEGDFYNIVLSKGIKAIITFGDCFKIKEVEDFYLDKSKRIPLIAGIDDYGNPLLIDGKNYASLLIAGKPRSGKSWYVNSILLSAFAFNTPEEIQALIIDPKQSNLFHTISLMPHVCGLHDDSNILQILDDVIQKEGSRRKKLLADNRCDDIWALRAKGINLPILYIVIDEVMTVMANLGADSTELEKILQVIITQLPSQGIFILIVPHRATGVVGPKTRSNIAFKAGVRTDLSTTQDTLDDKSWKRGLNDPGDTAVKLIDAKSSKFVKGLAISLDKSDPEKHDEAQKKTIADIATAFYKMGVQIPDMSNIGCGFNRNEKKIKEELEIVTNKRVQFELNDASDINFADYGIH